MIERRFMPEFQISVSSMGEVFRLNDKKVNVKAGKDGYVMIGVKFRSGRKNIAVHRLVAMAFLPNLENKPCVNHIDGIKDNNRLENLEWCTYSENHMHARRSGLFKTEPGRKEFKIRNDAVKLLLAHGYQEPEVASLFKISVSNVQRIRLGRTNTKTKISA